MQVSRTTPLASEVAPLPKTWEQLENELDGIIESELSARWYSGKGEVALNATDDLSPYQSEARFLQRWINECYWNFEQAKEANNMEILSNLPTLLL
jgi:hypothetical protein